MLLLQPYSGFTTDLLRVEENMRARRQRFYCILKDDEIAPTISAFPMMGVGDFCSPTHHPTPTSEAGFSQSKWVPDEVIK
jgi:glutamate--cysteine ligase catalytic subunit